MKAYPWKPSWGHHVLGRHGHGSPVKTRWRFSKFRKKKKNVTLTLTLKISILPENGLKQLTLVLFESLTSGLHILFFSLFGQTINWSTAKPWTRPKKKTLKWPWKIKVSSRSSKFRLCASLKTCDLQILGNAWQYLRGNLSAKKYFSPKILNFVQTFVECEVSLADGTLIAKRYSDHACCAFAVKITFISRASSNCIHSTSVYNHLHLLTYPLVKD